MCVDPGTAALALSIGSSVFGYASQKKNAAAQQRAIEQADVVNQESYLREEAQAGAQATDRLGVRARDAMIERGKIAAVLAESGLGGGVTADRITNESRFTEGTDVGAINSNRDATIAQLKAEARGATAGANSRLATIQQPSLIGTGLQIGATSFDQYNKNQTRSSKSSYPVS